MLHPFSCFREIALMTEQSKYLRNVGQFLQYYTKAVFVLPAQRTRSLILILLTEKCEQQPYADLNYRFINLVQTDIAIFTVIIFIHT